MGGIREKGCSVLSLIRSITAITLDRTSLLTCQSGLWRAGNHALAISAGYNPIVWPDYLKCGSYLASIVSLAPGQVIYYMPMMSAYFYFDYIICSQNILTLSTGNISGPVYTNLGYGSAQYQFNMTTQTLTWISQSGAMGNCQLGVTITALRALGMTSS